MKKISLAALVLLLLTALPSLCQAKAEDLIRINSNIEVPAGMVTNDIVCIGGNVLVAGKVEGNIVAVGGSVTLKARSSVGGEVIAVGGEVTKEEGASVAEKITQVYMPHFIPSLVNFMKGRWIALWATISLLALLGLLGLAILITALAPDHIAHTVNSLIRSFPTALLWGLLWAILIVPVIVLLAISIVGIILIPVVIFLVGLALICGYIAASIFIGKKVLASVKRHPFPFAEVITGILILFLIGFLPVAGALVKAVFLIAGFGAVITTRFGTIK